MKVLILVGLLASLSKGCQDEASQEEVLSFSEAFPFLKTSERRLFQQKSPDGDYVGELNCSSGFRQGWGEMRWANGSLYGPNNIFVYSQGDRYYGQWDKDHQEGIGTFESRTGIYIGAWKDGLQDGNGTVIYNNGNKYEGEFRQGFKNGYGKFSVTTVGDVYTGYFQNGMRNGQGIETYGSTGETYVGQFVNDTRWGLGTAYYQDGSPKYIGTWFRGSPDGNGTLFLQNGQKYIGEFQSGRPLGQGVLYSNGQMVKNGTFGPGTDVNDNSNTQSGSSSVLDIPKMLNLNLSNNKYTNLLNKIVDYLKVSWPFKK